MPLVKDEEGRIWDSETGQRYHGEAGNEAYNVQYAADNGLIRPDDERMSIIGPDGKPWYLAAQTQQGGVTPDNGQAVRESIASLGLDPNQHTYGHNGLPYVSASAAKALGQKYGGEDWGDTLAKMSIMAMGAALGAYALGPGIAGPGLASGAGGAATTAGLSAADLAGLSQMGIDAGLSGSALESFVASGGTLGSTAAGGGGIGLGAATQGGSSGGLSDLLNTPTTSGGAYDPYALTGPSTTGGTTTTAAANAGTLGGPATTPGLGAGGAAGLGTGPIEYGFNILDPATYSGATQGGVLELLKNIPTDYVNRAVQGTAGQSALSKVLAGTASAADYASLLGTLAQAGLGIYAGNQQAGAQEDLANKLLDFGAADRARYQASFAPDFNLFSSGAYKNALDSSTESMMRSISASSGANPWGNAGAMSAGQEKIMANLGLPALQQYRQQTQAAGIGQVPLYASSMQNAIGAEGGAWKAGAAGLESLMNPPKRYGLDGNGKIVQLP